MNELTITSVSTPVPSTEAERLIAEGLIDLAQAAELLPPIRGKRVSTNSLFRWCIRGKKKIRLESVKLHGDRFWTSQQAIARFATKLTVQEGGSQ